MLALTEDLELVRRAAHDAETLEYGADNDTGMYVSMYVCMYVCMSLVWIGRRLLDG